MKFSIPQSFNSLLERLIMRVAWRLPRRIVYWCAIRVWAEATTGKWSNQLVSTVTIDQCLDRWENRVKNGPECTSISEDNGI